MARYAIAGRSSIAGTTVRGQFSLYAVASRAGKVRECGLFNTTTTAFAAALARFTAAGTQGSALTEAKYDDGAPDPQLTGFAGHTGDATVGQVLRQASIGAAIGAGVIWTFGDTGLVIPAGTGNGIGPIIPTGTGQVTDFHLDWDE
jgi:hypothetical protein